MLTRRFVLLSAATLALVGCAPSPVISPSKAAYPATGLTDSRKEIASDEQDLAALADSIAAAGLSTSLTTWAKGAALAHHAHVTTLLRSDPLAGVNANNSPKISLTPATVMTPRSTTEAISALSSAYQQLNDDLDNLLNSEAPGPIAMLWTSLDAFATAATQTLAAHNDGNNLGPAPIQGQAVPSNISIGSVNDRLNALLSQIDALRFGLETMMGRSGNTRPDIAARRDTVDGLRNDVASRTTAVSATPSAPAINYTLPGDANDPSQWDSIWGQLENGVLAGWAGLAAASDPKSDMRHYALTSLASQTSQPLTHGIGTSWWPGWV